MKQPLLLLAPVLALVLLPANVAATALPLLRTEWSTSSAEAGWIFAAYQAGYIGSVLLLLPLTDRIPATRVIAACAAGSTAIFVLFPLLANGVWSAAILRALAGAGLAGVYMPGVRVVAAASPPLRRGLDVSIYVSAFSIGSATSLWASGFLLRFTDWRGAALVLAIVSAVAIPPALLATRGGFSSGSIGQRAVLRPSVLASTPLLRTILAYAGHSWELYVARGWLAAFFASVLAAQGLNHVDSASEGGQWAALAAGVGTIGVWLGGWLSDRRGRASAAALLALGSGLVSLGFGWLAGAGWGLLLLVACLQGVLMAADSGIYSTAVTELAPPGQLGSAQAAQAFTGFLASTVAPVAAGAVLDLGGGFGGAFMLAGLASILGAWGLLPLTRTRVAAYSPGFSPSTAATVSTTSDR